MKIAVLISGEYRTFKYCRPTMNFLEDSRVDVYFSTWNKTFYNSPKIDLNVANCVDSNIIIDDNGFKPLDTIIEDVNSFKETKYNSKMIHRWVTGFEMILKSITVYDYVIITRPDMYYDDKINLDNIVKFKDSMGVIWTHSLKEGKLSDVTMVSSFDIMKKIFTSLSVSKWINGNRQYDWHKWWYEYCSPFVKLSQLDIEYQKCSFYRCIVPNNTNDYSTIVECQNDWRDLKLLHDNDTHGRKFSISNWPVEVVENAERKWTEGYYDKYKNYGKDNL
jgi:hypothetical protein